MQKFALGRSQIFSFRNMTYTIKIFIDNMLFLAYRMPDFFFKGVFGGDQSEVLDREERGGSAWGW